MERGRACQCRDTSLPCQQADLLHRPIDAWQQTDYSRNQHDREWKNHKVKKKMELMRGVELVLALIPVLAQELAWSLPRRCYSVGLGSGVVLGGIAAQVRGIEESHWLWHSPEVVACWQHWE